MPVLVSAWDLWPRKVEAEAVVIDFPTRPRVAESAAALALASVVLTRKSTPKAIARCRKRVTRALERLAVTPTLRGAEPNSAAELIRQSCFACGQCARGNI